MRHHDDDTRDRRCDKGEEVGHDVQVRASYVEVSSIRLAEHARRGQVHGGSDQSDHQYQRAVDWVWA